MGERWRIGGSVVLQATSPRIPCATFAHRMGEPKWVRRFTARGATGTYLRVVTPGQIRAGDRIEVIRRPGHTVTIGRSFRALTTEPELLPSLLEAGDDLPRGGARGRAAPHQLTRTARRAQACRHDRDGLRGSRDKTRTYNLPVNSRLLCQLSYAGPSRTAGWANPDRCGAAE